VPSGRLTGGDQVPHLATWRRVRPDAAGAAIGEPGDIEYAQNLRRGLPLIGWWLLGLPQFCLAGVLAGGSGPGLVGILVGRQTAGCYVSSPVRRS